jgi:hypothetical protein
MKDQGNNNPNNKSNHKNKGDNNKVTKTYNNFDSNQNSNKDKELNQNQNRNQIQSQGQNRNKNQNQNQNQNQNRNQNQNENKKNTLTTSISDDKTTDKKIKTENNDTNVEEVEFVDRPFELVKDGYYDDYDFYNTPEGSKLNNKIRLLGC